MIQSLRKRRALFYAFRFNILMQKVTQQELFPCSAVLGYGTMQPNTSQVDFLTGFSPLVQEF